MTEERAVLAGGCFWGMQDLFRRYDGVISTRVGYSGGDVPNATYRNHGTHAEAIEIIFDPTKISYRRILEFFFQIHDPTTRNRQGNDVGTSYRSAIFYTSDEQRRIAEDTIADVEASGLWPGKVVTEVSPAGPFWEAEPEHQDYLERNPNGYTCHFIRPDWKLPARKETGRVSRAPQSSQAPDPEGERVNEVSSEYFGALRQRLSRGRDGILRGAHTSATAEGHHLSLCPLWVMSRHRVTSAPCPLFPQKGTFISAVCTSAKCQ